jgi:hypothetical protein
MHSNTVVHHHADWLWSSPFYQHLFSTCAACLLSPDQKPCLEFDCYCCCCCCCWLAVHCTHGMPSRTVRTDPLYLWRLVYTRCTHTIPRMEARRPLTCHAVRPHRQQWGRQQRRRRPQQQQLQLLLLQACAPLVAPGGSPLAWWLGADAAAIGGALRGAQRRQRGRPCPCVDDGAGTSRRRRPRRAQWARS